MKVAAGGGIIRIQCKRPEAGHFRATETLVQKDPQRVTGECNPSRGGHPRVEQGTEVFNK